MFVHCGDQKKASDALDLKFTESCELPSGLWELNLSSLKEQPDLVMIEQSFQLPILFPVGRQQSERLT